MALKSYVWRGPPTALDIWPATVTEATRPLYSGMLVPGRELPVQLPDDLHQVITLVAFNLLVEIDPQPAVVTTAPPADPEPPATEDGPRRRVSKSTKEPTDG